MVIQSMCEDEGRNNVNMNASGRRCASTVFIMIISGLILYLVYGVGARDLGERLAIRERRRKRFAAIKGKLGIGRAVAESLPAEEQGVRE